MRIIQSNCTLFSTLVVDCGDGATVKYGLSSNDVEEILRHSYADDGFVRLDYSDFSEADVNQIRTELQRVMLEKLNGN